MAMAQTGSVPEAGSEAHGRSTWSPLGPPRPWTHQLLEAVAAVDMLGGTWKRSGLKTLALARHAVF